MEQQIIDWQKVKDFVTDPEKVKRLFITSLPYIAIYLLFLYASNQIGITKEQVQVYMENLNAPLWVVFIGVQWVVSLTPLPDFPFLAAGIIFFRPAVTFMLIWVGMWFATIMNFYIARRLGRDYVTNRYPETMQWIDRLAGKYGFAASITARSFTFVPFDLVAYAAGISSMKITTFMASSVVGLVPIAANATLLGIALTSTLDRDFNNIYGFLRGVAVFSFSAFLSVAFGYAAQKFNNRLIKKENQAKADGQLNS